MTRQQPSQKQRQPRPRNKRRTPLTKMLMRWAITDLIEAEWGKTGLRGLALTGRYVPTNKKRQLIHKGRKP